jgi:hypothetical protein
MSARGPRYQAQLLGQTHYMADKPCKRGHLALRITNTGTCVECRKLLEKVRYYANPQKTKAQVAKKYRKNAEKIKARRKKAYLANVEAERAVAKLRSREWRKKNPAHRNALKRKYVADKRNQTPKWADLNTIVAFYKACPPGYHVDHELPLRGKFVSGLHVVENLQYLPAIENMRKNNKYMPA